MLSWFQKTVPDRDNDQYMTLKRTTEGRSTEEEALATDEGVEEPTRANRIIVDGEVEVFELRNLRFINRFREYVVRPRRCYKRAVWKLSDTDAGCKHIRASPRSGSCASAPLRGAVRRGNSGTRRRPCRRRPVAGGRPVRGSQAGPLRRAASHIDGAMSILTGIAGNLSMDTGNPSIPSGWCAGRQDAVSVRGSADGVSLRHGPFPDSQLTLTRRQFHSTPRWAYANDTE